MPAKITLAAYAGMYGPTVGDKVRLADTDLIIEVEKDFTTYVEEVKFGGGKVIRDGMGQGQATRAQGAMDTVITNALILDHWGIVKADIGIKDGRIAAIGKARNPDTQANVDIVIGPGTEAIAAEGKIVTAGGLDVHIHFICPQQIDEALYSGITTMMGGGTGPAAGTNATTCTPGPWRSATSCIRRSPQLRHRLPERCGVVRDSAVVALDPRRAQVHAVKARQHMNMGMKNHLPAGGFRKLLHRDTIGSERNFGRACNALHGFDQMRQIVGIRVENIARGGFGQHQGVAVGAGHDVHEDESLLVLVDLVAGHFATQDFGEDVGRIVFGRAGCHEALQFLAGFRPGGAGRCCRCASVRGGRGTGSSAWMTSRCFREAAGAVWPRAAANRHDLTRVIFSTYGSMTPGKDRHVRQFLPRLCQRCVLILRRQRIACGNW